MKFCDINIRDPFILKYDGRYYMYGTRAKYTWGDGRSEDYGFDVYVSSDLESWSEPKSIFEYYDGFFGVKDFWAPEVHYYNGKFYMFVTFTPKDGCRGTAVLVCDTPDGEFKVHSDGPLTPSDWTCLDGTFYVEDEEPYMIFCHEWTQIENGNICAIKLSKDLKKAISEPIVLWQAGDASWKYDIKDNGSYVTDGPFLVKRDKELIAIWSSFYKGEYCEAISRSDNGKLFGKWSIDDKLLYEKDGGHGMIFTDYENNSYFIFHTPNDTPNERPAMQKINLDALFNNK
ncbi:MAG: family 43 glycosylhydrolase [Clostridia bacterium]|nr:family 43 glycosylhydrolase [Clostridia bacterium]